jgi:UDP-N-acetylglucosamine diphosphorylase/glucosamine-1-phosphate N-acetyltransferase
MVRPRGEARRQGGYSPPMLRWILVDDGKGEFGPLVETRPFSQVRTGAFTVLDRFAGEWGPPLAVAAPPAFGDLLREQGVPSAEAIAGDEPLLVVNARLRGPIDPAALAEGEAWVDADGVLVAGRLRPAAWRSLLREGALPPELRTAAWSGPPLLSRPWEVLDDLPQRLAADLARRVGEIPAAEAEAARVEREGEGAWRLDPRASVGRGVVVDTSLGAVVVEAGAHVGHAAILQGPLWIGPGSRVIERAHLKPNTSIGPACKVGGEVGGTVFQGFSNKSHEGHLGDSWIGEWANVGAGTSNSNLLNTYGEVTMRLTPDSPIERTGRRYLGCLVGDHVKFPILARIMTGSSFGCGSMIGVADPPRTVGRFRWLSERGELAYRFDKFMETAETVFSRRGVTASAAMRARLAALHAASG